MERLTFTEEEMNEFDDLDCPVKNYPLVSRFCDRVCDEFQQDCPYKEMGKKLKVYEDAEEQGLLLRLPCKVGDTVWTRKFATRIDEEDGTEWTICDIKRATVVPTKFNLFMLAKWGDLYFLTKEEAEKKLAELN